MIDKKIVKFLNDMMPSCYQYYYYELSDYNKNCIVMKHKDTKKPFATFYKDKIEKILEEI